MIDVLFVVPSFAPQLKEESMGTLILAKIAMAEAESEDSPVQYFDSPEEFEAAMRAAEGGEPDGKRH